MAGCDPGGGEDDRHGVGDADPGGRQFVVVECPAELDLEDGAAVVGPDRAERDVGRDAPDRCGAAAIEHDAELGRQLVQAGLGRQAVGHVGEHIGEIDQLGGVMAGQRRPDDVAAPVTDRIGRGEAGEHEPVTGGGHIHRRDAPDLQVGPHGQLDHPGAEPLGHLGHGPEAVRADDAARKPDPQQHAVGRFHGREDARAGAANRERRGGTGHPADRTIHALHVGQAALYRL
jgi:hypothetical protein